MNPEMERLKMKKEIVLDDGSASFCNEPFNNKGRLLDTIRHCKTNDTVNFEDKNQRVKDLRERIASVINMTNAMPFKFFHNKFRCFYCTQEFSYCNDLKNHTRNTHPICETTFRAMKLKGRSAGVKIKVDTSSLNCKMCLQTFSDFTVALDHLDRQHNTNVKNLDILLPFDLTPEQFSCPKCGMQFRSFSTLLQHYNASHPDNSFICSVCGKPFSCHVNLRAHIVRYHSDVTGNKCSQCGEHFRTNNALKAHMGKSHGSKVIKCQKCAENFVSQYRMLRHMIKDHNGGHKCPYCSVVFIKYSFMTKHVRRLHLKEKNVQCSLCSLRFFDANRLKIHMVKHVGERDFRCDCCGKSFLRKKNLVRHVALHRRSDVGPVL